MANEAGARDLVEGADVRQARGSVARLEDHWVARRLALRPALQEFARLLVRPGLRRHCGVSKHFGVQYRCSSVLLAAGSWAWLLCPFRRCTQPMRGSGLRRVRAR